MLRIFLLVLLVRFLITFEKPILCASLFGLCSFVFYTMMGCGLGQSVFTALIEFGLASLMFLLLNRSEGAAWWLVFVAGVFVLGVV